ncbi:hypothetical protein, partial [Clostridium sp. HBUAS56017]|uniref:hypothetical protein n=1 Tax=Clostridium sp. HBUAS56017 TaxID=2571128 RepID=UPI001A9B33C4
TIYSAKLNNKTKDVILLYKKIGDGGGFAQLKNNSGARFKGSDLGHANDLTAVNSGTTTSLYIAPIEGKYENKIIKLNVNSSGYTFSKAYTVKYNGTILNKGFSGITYYKTVNGKQEFIVKVGPYCYIGTFDDSNNTLNCTRGFSLNYKLTSSDVITQGDRDIDFTNYIGQGICYYNNKIYIPLAKPSEGNSKLPSNVSIVLAYNLNDNTVNNSVRSNIKNDLFFRITSGPKTYGEKFEIEGVDFDSSGKLYFNTNRDGALGAIDSVSIFTDTDGNPYIGK